LSIDPTVRLPAVANWPASKASKSLSVTQAITLPRRGRVNRKRALFS
jgi:hypothetical protein